MLLLLLNGRGDNDDDNDDDDDDDDEDDDNDDDEMYVVYARGNQRIICGVLAFIFACVPRTEFRPWDKQPYQLSHLAGTWVGILKQLQIKDSAIFEAQHSNS